MAEFIAIGMSTRIVGRLAIGLSATAGLMLGTPGTSSAIDTGILTISGPANVANTGRCWDLGSNQPGAEVVLAYPCHYEDTYSSQKWYRTLDSNQVYNIQNANNLCMDLRSNAVGAHVIMAPCHYEDSYLSQKWYPVDNQPLTSATPTTCAWTAPTSPAARSPWSAATTTPATRTSGGG
ncbi:RICIN domain-containing protein [Streptomyces sp. NPDC048751]|uniref:RICIN domain-containing protein n=1 Tax=Streptomyces sp. NPDC048751 TaxID=3365591 RepID=UPI003720A574